MTTNYTPGPYEFRTDRTVVANGVPVARCYVGRNEVANGHLFAAAPDMLAALKDAIGALEFSRDFHNYFGNEEQEFVQDKLDVVTAAIAKAEGTPHGR